MSNVSSTSSLTLDTTDVVDIASRCTPNKLEKNQLPRPVVSVCDDAGITENCPVKYGFGCTFRIDFGELNGDEGKDFEPRLIDV